MPNGFVHTSALPEPPDLLAYLPAGVASTPGSAVSCWVRGGEGIVGVGTAHAAVCPSAAEAAKWWEDLLGYTDVTTDPGLDGEPAAGPIAFVSFPFAPDGEYVVHVPALTIGRRGRLSWVTAWDGMDVPHRARSTEVGGHAPESGHGATTLGHSSTNPTDREAQTTGPAAEYNDPNRAPEDCDMQLGHRAVVLTDRTAERTGQPTEVGDRTAQFGDPATRRLEFRPGRLDHDGWVRAVGTAVARIRAGQLDKVVLARDEIARLDSPVDVGAVLKRLATSYPDTWTFAVGNLVGATPELLARQAHGAIASRVLAGTIARDAGAAALAGSDKDRSEHEYAVDSVAAALRALADDVTVPVEPYVLHLPNVLHLASDITARARPGSTVLDLAAAIHPSAAVCGTPTAAAAALIQELEPMDRGWYAGPVGWVNAAGDGEIGLALRCGLISTDNVRIFAGCGLVADSDPEAEWAETLAKFQPMKQALGA